MTAPSVALPAWRATTVQVPVLTKLRVTHLRKSGHQGGRKVKGRGRTKGSATACDAAIHGHGVAIDEGLVVQDSGRGAPNQHFEAGFRAAHAGRTRSKGAKSKPAVVREMLDSVDLRADSAAVQEVVEVYTPPRPGMRPVRS